jgi:hypothetical protein
LVGPSWAGLNASTAPNALTLVESKLRRIGPTLRIVAPQASQRTAFQEYHGPYAGTVVRAEPLQIEDSTAYLPSVTSLNNAVSHPAQAYRPAFL